MQNPTTLVEVSQIPQELLIGVRHIGRMKRSGSFSADIDADIPTLEALAQHHFQLARQHLVAAAGIVSPDAQSSPFWSEMNSAWKAVQKIERARFDAIVRSATTI